MHLSTRIRIAGVAMLACLLLCLALVGTAFAATVNPHISVNRTHAITNGNGCATFKFSGSGFTESTNTVTNYADLTKSTIRLSLIRTLPLVTGTLRFSFPLPGKANSARVR